MVKKLCAFTLIEILMAVGIISIISVAAANSIKSTKTDEIKLRFKKCNMLIHKIVADLSEDTLTYPVIPAVNTTSGQPIHDSAGQTVYRGFVNNSTYFDTNFYSYLNKNTYDTGQAPPPTTQCGNHTSSNYCTYTAKDDSFWVIEDHSFYNTSPNFSSTSALYANLRIDVNGLNKQPNCPYTGSSLTTTVSSCTTPDTFCYKIYYDGTVEIESSCGSVNQTTYLKNNKYIE